MLELLGLLGILGNITEGDPGDDDLMPNTDTWRMLHPTEFNPYDPEPWGSNEYASDDEYDDC